MTNHRETEVPSGVGEGEHWDEVLARLDEAERSFGPYRAADGAVSFAAPSSPMVKVLIEESRHVVRYARDAESGNRVMAARLKEAEALLRRWVSLDMGREYGKLQDETRAFL
jgi:hypothetical protein